MALFAIFDQCRGTAFLSNQGGAGRPQRSRESGSQAKETERKQKESQEKATGATQRQQKPGQDPSGADTRTAAHQKDGQKTIGDLAGCLSVTYLVLDGHFGNNNALQMVRQCGLQLISKLRHDAALYFFYQGPYTGKGPSKKYGDKID